MFPEPTFAELIGLFEPDVPSVSVIPPEGLPEPYRRLLAHANHMTVTVELYYGSPVTLVVLRTRRDGDDYSREILLMVDGKAVQFGIVTIDLSAVPDAVKQAIEAGDAPLGRVLIDHAVLTRVQPVQYLRIEADVNLARLLNATPGTALFGRVGVIFAGGRPAIEVLEILAPVEPDADRE